jgi:hypothetical protein
VLYSTLLLLPPLRFLCVGGCWDLTQDYLVVHEVLAQAEVGDGDALVPLVQHNVSKLQVSNKCKLQ